MRRVGFGSYRTQYRSRVSASLAHMLDLSNPTRERSSSLAPAHRQKSPLARLVFVSVRRVGFEPTKPEGARFTVSCVRPLHHRRVKGSLAFLELFLNRSPTSPCIQRTIVLGILSAGNTYPVIYKA